MEIEQKESREETLKGFGVYHVDGAEYNVDEDVFFKEIFKLEAEIKALREAKLTVNEREWALKYRLLILDAKTLAVKTNQLELAAMIRAIEVHVNEILLPTPNQK